MPERSSAGSVVPARNNEPFDPDRFFEVTIRYWDRTETDEVQSSLTLGQAKDANRGAIKSGGWPIYVQPARLAALSPPSTPNRSRFTSFFLRRFGLGL